MSPRRAAPAGFAQHSLALMQFARLSRERKGTVADLNEKVAALTSRTLVTQCTDLDKNQIIWPICHRTNSCAEVARKLCVQH